MYKNSDGHTSISMLGFLMTLVAATAMGCGQVADADPDADPEEAPHIASIDGNGSVDGEDGYGAHRIATGLVIHGERLDGAQAILERGRGSEELPLLASAGHRLEVGLPVDLEEGTYPVTVLNEKGDDQADVQVLRGEPGPRGPGLEVIETNTTIAVDTGDCADLVAAIRSLDGKAIAGLAVVTIEVAGGPYACAESLVFNHRDGQRIQVVGNPGGVATTISFEGVSGVVVGVGRALRTFDGFVLSGTGDGGNGVHVNRSATAHIGGDVSVEGFSGSCYFADTGAVLAANGSEARQCGAHGYRALRGKILARGALAQNNAGSGFVADRGAFIEATVATAQSNGAIGFHARSGATVRARGAESIDNASQGFLADRHAFIDATIASASGNSLSQYAAGALSLVHAPGATIGAGPGGPSNIPFDTLSASRRLHPQLTRN